MAEVSGKSRFRQVAFTIEEGGATSNSVDLGGEILMGLVIPDEFTSTTLTPKISQDNANFYPICDVAGTAYTIAPAAALSSYVYLSPGIIGGGNFVQLVTNSTESAARTLIGFTRALS